MSHTGTRNGVKAPGGDGTVSGVAFGFTMRTVAACRWAVDSIKKPPASIKTMPASATTAEGEEGSDMGFNGARVNLYSTLQSQLARARAHPVAPIAAMISMV